MRRCPKCGTEAEDQYKFCPNDATRLPEPEPASSLGASVPTRGWTQVFAAVSDAAEPAATTTAPAATPPPVATTLNPEVPTRGWTQVFAAVDSLEAQAPSAAAPITPEPWPEPTPAPVVEANPFPAATPDGGPVRGFTQVFAAINSLEQTSPEGEPAPAPAPTPEPAPPVVARPFAPVPERESMPPSAAPAPGARMAIAGVIVIAVAGAVYFAAQLLLH